MYITCYKHIQTMYKPTQTIYEHFAVVLHNLFRQQYIHDRLFIFSILHKTIVFPSPGAHTLAAHHHLTCRYWIRIRIMFIRICFYKISKSYDTKNV